MRIPFIRLARSLLAAAFAVACSNTPAAPAGQPRSGARQDPAVPVAVADVIKKPMPLEIRAIGTAEANTTVAVRSQLTGELLSINFREGDDVQQGQVLFTLDRRPLELALQQAESNLDRDLALAANARAQTTRYEDLARRGIATREQVDQLAANAKALDATVAADRAGIENAKVQLQYATITARISGRTGALMVHSGNLVRANDTTPLVVINQVTPISVSFGIPEAQLREFKKYLAGGSMRIDANLPDEADPPASGRITMVDNAVDQTTGTIRVKGTFPNHDRLFWPGQFVNITVTLTTDPDALVVPTVAVQAGADGQYVFVVKSDQTVDIRSITVERMNGAETIIRDGLTAGETVVTDGHVRLVKGSRVSFKTASTEKVAP